MAAISMETRRELADDVAHTWSKFWRWKCPCPVDPLGEIYRAAYTDKEWIAMRYLQQRRADALKVGTRFRVKHAPNSTVSFSMEAALNFPNVTVDITDLPEATQCKLRTWIDRVLHYRKLQTELVTRVNGMLGNPHLTYGWKQRRFVDLDPRINSAGQLYRLWPELQPLLPKKMKREIQLASTKSPLPKLLGYRVNRDGASLWANPAQFRAEDPQATEEEKQTFREINDIILMVSLAGDVPDVKDFPSFT